MKVRTLLERAQPGKTAGVRAHIRRGIALAQAIEGRWPDLRTPRQWRAKHLRWALEVWAAQWGPPTRYDYWRTARVLAAALGRWPDWEPHLRGPWCRPDGAQKPRGAGGRPAKLAARGQGKGPSQNL